MENVDPGFVCSVGGRWTSDVTMGYHLCFMSDVKPRFITLTFMRYFNVVGFGELTVYDFRFMKSPSCDLALAFLI
jgi:hypothetical protein